MLLAKDHYGVVGRNARAVVRREHAKRLEDGRHDGMPNAAREAVLSFSFREGRCGWPHRMRQAMAAVHDRASSERARFDW